MQELFCENVGLFSKTLHTILVKSMSICIRTIFISYQIDKDVIWRIEKMKKIIGIIGRASSVGRYLFNRPDCTHASRYPVHHTRNSACFRKSPYSS